MDRRRLACRSRQDAHHRRYGPRFEHGRPLYGRSCGADVPRGQARLGETESLSKNQTVFNPYWTLIYSNNVTGVGLLLPTNRTPEQIASLTNAVALYRRLLKDAQPRSVVICSTGFLNNLKALMESAPNHGGDDIASSGLELIAAKKVVEEWPTPPVRFAAFYGIIPAFSAWCTFRQRRKYDTGREKVYIQSAYGMNDPTQRARETLPLVHTDDSCRKCIITDGNQKLWTDEDGISHVGILSFLLTADVFYLVALVQLVGETGSSVVGIATDSRTVSF